LLGPQRQRYVDFLEAEMAVDLESQIDQRPDLPLELLLGTKNVGIILGEAARAQQPVQGPGRFVAMNHAEFRDLERQIAVTPESLVENLDVAGTVHRFDRVLAVLGMRSEDHVVELFPMSRTLP
jgi:hypothetical protein